MERVYEYSRIIDVYNQIIEYRVIPEMKDWVIAKFEFESEESHFAPEPSVASRVRASDGGEFVLILLQHSNQLMVLNELGVNREESIKSFMGECPELLPYLLHTYPIPPSDYPSQEVIDAHIRHVKRHTSRDM